MSHCSWPGADDCLSSMTLCLGFPQTNSAVRPCLSHLCQAAQLHQRGLENAKPVRQLCSISSMPQGTGEVPGFNLLLSCAFLPLPNIHIHSCLSVMCSMCMSTLHGLCHCSRAWSES